MLHRYTLIKKHTCKLKFMFKSLPFTAARHLAYKVAEKAITSTAVCGALHFLQMHKHILLYMSHKYKYMYILKSVLSASAFQDV